jgi:hypothetical protein
MQLGSAANYCSSNITALCLSCFALLVVGLGAVRSMPYSVSVVQQMAK